MNLLEKIRANPKKIKQFIILFYTIGLAGILIPVGSSFFIRLTPFAILLSSFLLAVFHKCYTIKTIILFALIFTLGFFIEVLGVNTGLIFGEYQYGYSLGIKYLNTPLLIGLNWLMMIYLTASVSSEIKLSATGKVIFASLLMLSYDFVMEQSAYKTNMWDFKNHIAAPLQNYIAWFILSLFFHSLLKLVKIELKNPLAGTIYLAQLLFFTMLFFK